MYRSTLIKCASDKTCLCRCLPTQDIAVFCYILPTNVTTESHFYFYREEIVHSDPKHSVFDYAKERLTVELTSMHAATFRSSANTTLPGCYGHPSGARQLLIGPILNRPDPRNFLHPTTPPFV